MRPTGTEEDYIKLKRQLANVIYGDVEIAEKIKELYCISWTIPEKFEIPFGEETELTNQACELYKKVKETIQSLEKY